MSKNVKTASADKKKSAPKAKEEANGPNPEVVEKAEEAKQPSSPEAKKTNLPPVSRIIANLFKTIAIEEGQVSPTNFA